MKIIESIEEMREYSQQLKREGKTIASVETAGDLHEGHMSLVKIAKENADVVILSIGHVIDYVRYSEEYEERQKKYRQTNFILDIELCQSHGVDILFHYPDSSWNYEAPLDIPIPTVERLMKHRDPPPVLLETLIPWPQILDVERPDVNILGQKDIYQNFVVKSIIGNLNFPIKVIMAPIIRDSDGLACSSRNVYLTPSERQNALSIYQALQEVSSWSKTESINYIKTYITHRVKSEHCYVDICCAETLEELNTLDRDAVIVITAKFGDYAHTDNIFIYQ
jgi:pantoate--beta-alanine ligase